MKDLEKMVLECTRVMSRLGIPYETAKVSYNGRIRTKWGYCRKTPDGFIIAIAKRLGDDDVPMESLLATLYHEFLHTCPGCFNHGKKWREYGKMIKKETGIKIREATSADQLNVTEDYYLKCRKCKIKFLHRAMKPRNDHPHCPYCGSGKISCFMKKDDGSKERIWKND